MGCSAGLQGVPGGSGMVPGGSGGVSGCSGGLGGIRGGAGFWMGSGFYRHPWKSLEVFRNLRKFSQNFRNSPVLGNLRKCSKSSENFQR